jgi:hypothetical protein
MLLRKRRALRELPIDDSSDHEGTKLTVEMADASPDPEVSYLKAERARPLCAAVEELSPGILRAVEFQSDLNVSSILNFDYDYHSRLPLAKERDAHLCGRRSQDLSPILETRFS